MNIDDELQHFDFNEFGAKDSYSVVDKNQGEIKMENQSLTHHGINGQRWGVRRFQNPDGTLTAAGKRRYSTMSDEELSAVTKRLQAEENLYNLEKKLAERENPQKTYTAKKVGEDIFSNFFYEPLMKSGKAYVTAVMGRGMRYTGAALSSGNSLNGKDFTKALFEGKKIDKYVEYFQNNAKR